ncbi:hypothetical protein JCM10207_005526 [Rhodosporidiobolus poonsookiae]
MAEAPVAAPEAPASSTEAKPYYDTPTGGIAPIKPEFVLWHKLKSGQPTAAIDDDVAEGRSTPALSKPLRTGDVAAVPAQTADPTSTDSPAPEPSAQAAGTEKVDGAPGPPGEAPAATEGADEPEAKKVRLNGAQKKAAAKKRQQEEWEARKAAKEAAKADGAEGAEGGKKKAKGQNKGRKFDHKAGSGEIRLCNILGQGRPCDRPNCRADHDLAGYLAARQPDIRRGLPVSSDDLTPTSSSHTCPLFLSLGACPFGFKCRFGESHMRKVEDGQGFMGCGWEIVVDEERVKQRESERGEGKAQRSQLAEMNYITTMQIKDVRGGGKTEEKFPLSSAYLKSIGEPLDTREDNGRGKGKGKKRGRDGKAKEEEVEAPATETPATDAPATEASTAGASTGDAPAPTVGGSAPAAAMEVDSSAAAPATTASDATPATTDVDSHPYRSFVPDLAPIRASEKKRLDFAGKMWMAPLTTVGNLPFRRLAVEYGCDITVSEMGLAQEFLGGNANEWSLLRRHPSEKTFGVQICGSKPQVLVPAAEAIVKNTEIDFLDINCGCPIDLVFNKGAGSALLAHANKLGKSLVGMAKVLGEVPLTIKIRTGVTNTQPTAHKLMPRLQKEWGVSAVTMHGRSRQQRYKSFADYKYIGECVKVLRETAADEDLAPIPIFGNGDAYDHRAYWENVEASGVDGIMVARGALIKPWIFTELKERRDWDISSRERLDMIGKLCDYGLEHWGSDQIGVNKTRRFVCESLSFTHRYIPVGLLERGADQSVHMNQRPFPYKGRDELETLLASDQAKDWVNITSMFLGPPPEDWSFLPKEVDALLRHTRATTCLEEQQSKLNRLQIAMTKEYGRQDYNGAEWYNKH